MPNNGSLMSRDYLVFKTHKCDLYEVFDGNPLDMPSSRCYIRNWYHWRLNGFASTMSLIGYRWEFDVCDESDFMRNTCNNRVLKYQWISYLWFSFVACVCCKFRQLSTKKSCISNTKVIKVTLFIDNLWRKQHHLVTE